MTEMAKHNNNFDLVRLAAASQVMVIHAAENLRLEARGLWSTVEDVLALFPGVPIFFVISGFLVSRSYEQATTLSQYAKNRFLRIYPGLLSCTFLTLCLFLLIGRAEITPTSVVPLVKWLAAQLTIFQFYVPVSLKQAYGVGHWNGSLWTIPVELQFYALLPLIYLVARRKRSNLDLVLVALLFVSAMANVTLDYGRVLIETPWETAFALWRTSAPPYLYMFLIGVLAQRHWSALASWLEGRAVMWLLVYLAVALGLWHGAGIQPGGNSPNLVSMTALALLTLSAAFTKPALSHRMLAGADISYGVYIYHMVVVNAVWELGGGGSLLGFGIAIGLTCALAVASWRFVEKPALQMKRRQGSTVQLPT